jgi:hypothetical protein
MRYPWRELKETEMRLLAQRRKGRLHPATIGKLRRLISTCAGHKNAKHSICFRGAMALACEAAKDLPVAIRYRETEVRLICRLHDLVKQNPKDHPALVNYGRRDLAERRKILNELKLKEESR